MSSYIQEMKKTFYYHIQFKNIEDELYNKYYNKPLLDVITLIYNE